MRIVNIKLIKAVYHLVHREKERIKSMLELKDIVKEYSAGDTRVEALRGVSLRFRESEFVSILGQSGCGKTTMLNIIGGLDKYTSGDLIINGVSTKQYKDADWDSYRNHTIGFVFQSYNLIPHQTVLSNVELALTLSGVSKAERKKRAKEALEKVGLGDQLHKKPNQMSGGQMQRVAIARALVNNPDILLADEPTGALDSETSVQIMELLKEIAKDRLIIMVTHNPELAGKYSTRIIKLLDGRVVDDSDPYTENVAAPIKKPEGKKSKKEKKSERTSMSFLTALSLSLNNLMTKKGRTFMTSFAGSIGIIGIALILALSSGANAYIAKVEEDTLSSYPLTIENKAVDFSSIMMNMSGEAAKEKTRHEDKKIYSDETMTKMMDTLMSEVKSNDLKSFKAYLESSDCNIKDYTSDIQYGYSTQLNIYKADTSEGAFQINPSGVMESLGFGSMVNSKEEASSIMGSSAASMMMGTTDIWMEMLGNSELIGSQYDVVAGKMPENYNEVVVVVDKNNEINEYSLYTLGLKDNDELSEVMAKIQSGETAEEKDGESSAASYTYDEILGLKFKLVVNTDYFEKENGVWIDKSNDTAYMKNVVDNAEEVKVVGIIRPAENAKTTSLYSGVVAYRSDLMKHLINKVNESEIVKEQKENPDTDIFTGIAFDSAEASVEAPSFKSMDELSAYMETLPEDGKASMTQAIQQMQQAGMGEEEILAAMNSAVAEQSSLTTDATYENNLVRLGVSNLDEPANISIYPKDFESKESITGIIDDYNKKAEDEGNEDKTIEYTDYIGLMMSSVSSIINAISYILMAVVAISLVVSPIMIGIITYISVLERTKEIGILRSIGASKHDISRVFNAETLIVGFAAGAIGIIVTVILTIPINAVIKAITDVSGVAKLPVAGAVILIVISMLLTVIAGLIPAKYAAKKDPVTALRSE